MRVSVPRACVAVTTAWLLVRLVATCGASENPVPRDRLPKLALAAKQEFRTLTADDLQQRKADLLAAMGDLEDFLATGEERQAQGWKSYLHWEDLRLELGKREPSVKNLQALLPLYYAQHPGLERIQFRHVRDALGRYADALAFVSDATSREMFEKCIDDLSRRLQTYAEKPSSDDGLAIGRYLGWLERRGQAEQLVSAVRGQYWRPNLFAQVSQRLLATAFERPVDEVQPVNEVILGTSIHGRAFMSGNVALTLVPDDERASFEIRLLGQATSNNVGHNGPVVIYSRGVTHINARKRIHADIQGLQGDRSLVRCSTSSRIQRIAARCEMVRRIAWKRALRTKPEAERIASSRAQRRVARRFEAQTWELLEDANQRLAEKIRAPLLRRDSFPNAVKLRTTENALLVELLRAGSNQMAAPLPPPLLAGQFDVAVRVHDSLIANMAETMIGGETLTDEKLVEMLEQGEMEVPEELRIGPDKDPWSITFSRDRPIGVTFAQDRVTLAIQGRQFTRGDQEIRETLRISASYQLQRANGTARLVREGEVEVAYPYRKSLSLSQVAMKTFFRKKFEALFKPEIVGEGLVPPGRWQAAGRLVLRQLTADDGWLTIAWDMAPEKEAPPAVAAAGALSPPADLGQTGQARGGS